MGRLCFNTEILFEWAEEGLPALNINGNNYLKVTDIAELFDAEIIYDEELNNVYINTFEAGYENSGAANFGLLPMDFSR